MEEINTANNPLSNPRALNYYAEHKNILFYDIKIKKKSSHLLHCLYRIALFIC